MGAVYKNVCYPNQDYARAEFCSAFGTSAQATTNVYTSECTSTVYTGTTFNICKRTNGGACTNVAQPWPVMPSCSHDGGVSLAYDWFIASIAFLCIVWGGKKLIQLFDHNHIES